MAKKNTDETPVEETVEAQAEATETEAPEEVIDLTDFDAAVEAALENADESTGDVPEADIAKVRAAYQALPGIKPKNAAKQALSDGLKKQMSEGSLPGARVYMTLTEKAAVAGASKSTAKPVDPTEAFRTKVTTLTLAGFLASQDVPEGVDNAEEIIAEAQAKAGELFTEAIAVYSGDEGATTESPVVKAAVKLAATKVRKNGAGRISGSGERRDLGAHIQAAFDAAEAGQFLTVAEIKKFKSDIYGDDVPSAGAITNRLQPKSGKPTTIEGITVETRDGKLGAVKN